MAFHKAERSKAKLRLALCAVAGSGKTYSALLIAQGLGGKIAMIDTENRSGELYAKLCDYDACQITASYTPDKYIAAIKEAEEAGYNVIIIDSLSHAWAGEGGLLDKHDEMAKASRSGNSYTAWREITPLHNRLVDTILQSPCHIIASMRSKTAYEVVDDGSGKKAPRKIGMAPVQRDGMEYEFTVVLDMSVESHIASSSKDRTGIFDGQYFKPTVETGKQLLSWLEDGDAEWQPLKKDDPEETEKPRPEKSAPRRKAPEPQRAGCYGGRTQYYRAYGHVCHGPRRFLRRTPADTDSDPYCGHAAPGDQGSPQVPV